MWQVLGWVTATHLITEVTHCWAGLVPGWVTVQEYPVL